MDVAVSEFRAHLSDWLARVRAGDEVVITERGVPVARLRGLASTDVLERLTADGLISRPERAARPTATGLRRPRPRRPVAGRVSAQRR